MAAAQAAQSGCNAYFDGMKEIGKKHKHMFWIFSICYFFDMMDMNLFGSLGASVQATFALTNEQVSQLSSLSFYGMFFGGLLGGWMADKIGRKKALLYNVLIFSLASLGNALIDNYFIFAFCRFMTGFGIIGMNIIAMVYIAEMMPAHSRGKYQGQMAALGSLGIPFGIILAAIVVPRSPEAWRIMFLIGAVGILLFPIGLKWLYESPRWLVGQGRIEEADRVVEEMSGMPSNLAAVPKEWLEKGNVSYLPDFQQNRKELYADGIIHCRTGQIIRMMMAMFRLTVMAMLEQNRSAGNRKEIAYES